MRKMVKRADLDEFRSIRLAFCSLLLHHACYPQSPYQISIDFVHVRNVLMGLILLSTARFLYLSPRWLG